MTRDAQFAAAVGVLAAVQGWAALRFIGLLRREASRPPPARRPPASVLVPCKGSGPNLARRVRAMLAQEYPDAEFLFVVPGEADPAFATISAAVAGDPRARVLASNAAPRRCSGKIADLGYAAARVSSRAEILAFADADLEVAPDWLARLAAPLEEPGVGVSTSCMLYVAADAGLWSFLRMAWMAAGMPHLAALGVVAGHSFALRRRDFEAHDVAGLWSRSLMEDLALAALARSRGLGVRFSAAAMPVSEEACGAGEFFALFTKWLSCFRVYDRRVWLQAALACAAHAWIVYACLRRGVSPRVAGALWLADGAYLASVFAALRRFAPGRLERLHPLWAPAEAWALLLAPLLWAAYCLQVAASSWPRDVRWGGRVYRVRGPQDVEVVG